MPDYDDAMNYAPFYPGAYREYTSPGMMCDGCPYYYGFGGFPSRYDDGAADYRLRPFGFGGFHHGFGGSPFGLGFGFGPPFGFFPFFFI